MKIGIITFQKTNNYGGILQNYALQRVVTKMGAEVETIDYQSEYISKPYRLCHLRRKGLATYLFGLIGYICYCFRTGNNRQFRKNIKYSAPVKCKELKSLNQKYDKFITGSDQVWNFNLTGHDGTYLLDFVEDPVKKNSYAASIGVQALNETDGQWLRGQLEDYNQILVREKSAAGLLGKVLGRDIDMVLDPVFLLDMHEWKKVIPKVYNRGRYICVYQLGVSPQLVAFAKKAAKEYNCKLVFLPFPMVGFAAGKYKITAGAGELLAYIANAEYVITDSFHGTAFSILFHKKFSCLVSGTHGGVSSRIRDMLAMFGLEQRIWQEKFNLEAEIAWDSVDKILDEEKKRSLQHLRAIVEEQKKPE